MPPGPTMKGGLLAAALGTCVGRIVILTESSEAYCPLMKSNIRFGALFGLLAYCLLLSYMNKRMHKTNFIFNICYQIHIC